jgi:hypothetical protein
MLVKRNFFACLHEDTNSLRLFKVANSGLHICTYNKEFFPQTEITSIRSRAVGFGPFQGFPFKGHALETDSFLF